MHRGEVIRDFALNHEAALELVIGWLRVRMTDTAEIAAREWGREGRYPISKRSSSRGR